MLTWLEREMLDNPDDDWTPSRDRWHPGLYEIELPTKGTDDVTASGRPRLQNGGWGNARTRREKNLWRLYGLTPEDVESLWFSQGCRCANAGCQAPLLLEGGAKAGSAHIDHDHQTGKVRGLLCPTCNIGLGSFAESPEKLRGAADYLESHAA